MTTDSQTTRRRKRLVGILAGVAAVTAVAAGPAPPAEAASYTVTFSGVIQCTASQGVQGVWVENFDGSDGWASWWAFPGYPDAAKYSITVTASRPDPAVRLDVGCGGTPQRWKKTILTPDFRTRNGYTETRKCDSNAAERARACTPAPKGQTLTWNPGAAGYCTWGAAQQWKAAVGSYPYLSGNAYRWYESAKSRGFRTTPFPQPMSIFVKGAVSNVGPGHVGWVTNVRKVGSTVYFDTIEMNGGSGGTKANDWRTNEFNRFTVKSRVWRPGDDFRFIIAPT